MPLSPDLLPLAPTAAPAPAPTGDTGSDLLLPQLPAPSGPATAPGTAVTGTPDQGGGAAPDADLAAQRSKTTKKKAKVSWRRKHPKLPPSPTLKADLARWDEQLAIARKGAAAQLVGLNLFVWPYVPSLIVGALALDAGKEGITSGLGLLCVPVVGPFLTLAVGQGVDDIGVGALIADGALQSIGALTFLVGTVVRGNAERAAATWTLASSPGRTPVSMQVAPVVTPTTTGVALSGSF